MQDDITGDIVTTEWLERHRIAIPRAVGTFVSPTGWVRVGPDHRIVAAGENDQTILAWLVTRSILRDQDVDYGIDYVTCRSADRAYRKQKGFKSSLDISILSVSAGLSCEQAAMVFSLVRRQLGLKTCQVIEYACDTVRGPDMPNYNPPYRKAFAMLGQAIEDAVRQVRSGEVSDDPQAEGMKKLHDQKAGLKKMLARTVLTDADA